MKFEALFLLLICHLMTAQCYTVYQDTEEIQWGTGANHNPCIYEGTYRLCLQEDFDIVLYEGDGFSPLWSAGTSHQANPYTTAAILRLGSDGQLRLLEVDETDHSIILFTQNVVGQQNRPGTAAPYFLHLQADRNLRIVDYYDNEIWSSATYTHVEIYRDEWTNVLFAFEELHMGDCLKSPNGVYKFCVEHNTLASMYDLYGTKIWDTDSVGPNNMSPAYIQIGDNWVELKDSIHEIIFVFVNYAETGKKLRLVLQNDRNLIVYDQNDNILWEAETDIEDKIERGDIIEVVFDDFQVPADCSRSLASATSIANQTPNPISASVEVDWSKESTSRTKWYNTLFVESVSTFSIFGVGFQFTIQNTFHYEEENIQTSVYAFSQKVETITGPNKVSTANLLACAIEDVTIPFTATIMYTSQSGKKTFREERGEWQGSAYSSFIVTMTETDIPVY